MKDRRALHRMRTVTNVEAIGDGAVLASIQRLTCVEKRRFLFAGNYDGKLWLSFLPGPMGANPLGRPTPRRVVTRPYGRWALGRRWEAKAP